MAMVVVDSKEEKEDHQQVVVLVLVVVVEPRGSLASNLPKHVVVVVVIKLVLSLGILTKLRVVVLVVKGLPSWLVKAGNNQQGVLLLAAVAKPKPTSRRCLVVQCINLRWL